MVNRPKRRIHKDNPYTLNFDEEKQIYTVSFKDANNIFQLIEISKSVYDAFNSFELEDLSQMNEYDNHIEHSEIYEETLYKRAIDKKITLEEIVEKKLMFEKLSNAIKELPIIQRNRFKKYYLDGKTYEQIAIEENCTKRAVKFSVDIAIIKISKKLKN